MNMDNEQFVWASTKVNFSPDEYWSRVMNIVTLKIIKNKLIILSHQMNPGLKQVQGKMSKSDIFSAIYMEGSVQDVNSKIKKEFCPKLIVENKAALEYFKHL